MSVSFMMIWFPSAKGIDRWAICSPLFLCPEVKVLSVLRGEVLEFKFFLCMHTEDLVLFRKTLCLQLYLLHDAGNDADLDIFALEQCSL